MSEFHIDRSIFVRATRETVWRFFEEPALFARWWGEGSSIEARVGAPMKICYPNGDSASGEVKSLRVGEEIVFSFGYDQEGKPIAPGGSLVRIELAEREGGTLISLRHTVGDEATRDLHVPGWRYQMALFAKALCDEQHSDAAARVEKWFAAWNVDDEAERARLIADCTTEDVHFADAYGNLAGREELQQHIATARQFMPVELAQAGAPRQNLGSALVDWEMKGPDGSVMARGTNLMQLHGDGRIASVVGIPG